MFKLNSGEHPQTPLEYGIPYMYTSGFTPPPPQMEYVNGYFAPPSDKILDAALIDGIY